MALTKWEQEIYTLVRKYSGASKADTEGADLPGLVDECMGMLAQSAQKMSSIGHAAFKAGWQGDAPIEEFVCARLTASMPTVQNVDADAEMTERQAGQVASRDEAIRVWHQYCDKFSIFSAPSSAVIDAMLAFAQRANSAPAAEPVADGHAEQAKSVRTMSPYLDADYSTTLAIDSEPAEGNALPPEIARIIPGGKHTDAWESARVADYNAGWNDYRKAMRTALTAFLAGGKA